MSSDYWDEAVMVALEEANVQATEDQIKQIAGAIQVSHECFGMAHGYDAIPNPVVTRAEEELRALKREIEKRERWVNSTSPCERCTTTGLVFDMWGRDVTCDKCGGEGRV